MTTEQPGGRKHRDMLDTDLLQHYVPDDDLLDYYIRQFNDENRQQIVAALCELKDRRHNRYRQAAVSAAPELRAMGEDGSAEG